MAQTIKAGEPFHWMGHDYAIGDVIDTTGWSQRAVRQLMMRAPVYVDPGAPPPAPPSSSAASAVTVDPSGLIVVNTTNVQAALAQLDSAVGAKQPANLEGLLANRPAANSVPAKTVYFATDDNGGTMYRSNGTSWLQLAPGTAMAVGQELGYAAITANAAGLTATANTDVAGLSTTFTLTASTKVEVAVYLPQVALALTSGSGYLMAFLTDGGNTAHSRGAWSTTSVAGTLGTIFIRHREVIAAGTTTFKVRYAVSGTGASATIYGNANYPASIQVKAIA